MQDAGQGVGEGDEGDAVQVVDVPFVHKQGIERREGADEAGARCIGATIVVIRECDAEEDDPDSGQHRRDAVLRRDEAQARCDVAAKKTEHDRAECEQPHGQFHRQGFGRSSFRGLHLPGFCDEENHAERVIRGEERGQKRTCHVNGKTIVTELGENFFFAPEPGQWGHARQSRAADEEAEGRGFEVPPPAPSDFGYVVGVKGVDVDARAEKEQGFENRVRDQVEDAREQTPRREGHQHKPELADRGIREHLFDVAIDHGDGGCEQGRERGDAQNDERGVLRGHEERVQADHQKDPCGHHRRRVQQRADRRRAFHRVWQPGVQGELRAFAHNADENEQCDGIERAGRYAGPKPGFCVQEAGQVKTLRELENEQNPDEQAHVA